MKFNNFKGYKLREAILFVLINLLLITDLTQFFLQSNTRQILILSLPIIMLFFFKKYKITYEGKIILFCYFALVIYSIPITVLNSGYDGLVNLFKTYYRIFILIVLLLIINPKNFTINIVKFPLILCLFFSMQAIILNGLLLLGYAPPSKLVYNSTIDQFINSYGILGHASIGFITGSNSAVFGEALTEMKPEILFFRAESFFSESSRLALFLEYGIIMSIGFYKIYKKKRFIISFIICLVAFIMTFSHAGFFAIIITFLIYQLQKGLKKDSHIPKAFVIIVGSVIILGIISLVRLFFTKLSTMENAGILGATFGKGEDRFSLLFEWIWEMLMIFIENPFGIGLGLFQGTEGASAIVLMENHIDKIPSNAFALWLVQTGFLGAALVVFILLYVYKKIVIRTIKKPNTIACFLGLSFISQTIHHLSYGSWMDSMYFLTMALIIVTYRFNFETTIFNKEVDGIIHANTNN